MFRNDKKTRWLSYALILLFAALLLPSSAMAHKPLFVEGDISYYEQAFEIPDAAVSYAAYHQLTDPQRADVYKVTLPEEGNFYARLSVPVAESNFAPTLLLLGPGLPTIHTPPNYPLSLDDDQGRAIYSWQGEADEFFEPFTQTTLLQRQYISRKLPAGTYYLVVYSPEGQTGRYVLATGEREDFSFADWLSFPVTWYKVRMWYNPAQTVLLLAGLFAAVGGLLYYLQQKRDAS